MSMPHGDMIPATEVAAMLEAMKTEQARMLQEQQHVIVQQVIQSLAESGLPVEKKPNASKKPSRLEANLHSLVLHSLEESGLDFPHVQQNVYTSKSLRRHPVASQARTKVAGTTVLVVAREEEGGGSMDPEAASEAMEMELNGGEASGQERPRSSATNKCASNEPGVLRDSPLHTAAVRRDRQRKLKKKPRKQREASVEGDEDGDHSDAAVSRRKLGHKTLAILDRSRALVDEVRNFQCNRPIFVNAAAETTFAHRMRQKLQEANSFVHTGEAESQVSTDLGEDEGTDGAAAQEETAESASPVGDVSGDERRSNLSRPSSSSSSEGGEYATAEQLDIDILRPPETQPENENEWENELARQILTIYATSVKAKASNQSPVRLSNRLGVPSSAQSGPRLKASCSLPAIGRPSSQNTQSSVSEQPKSPKRATVHYSWEPSQRLRDGKVVINMPKVPRPIWFAGTGAVKAVWCAIADGFQSLEPSPTKPKRSRGAAAVCEHQLCEEVRRLEAKQRYVEAITMLETLLVSLVRARGVDELETTLWKQLVVTCNAFASRCVDYKKFPMALQLIKLAEHLLHNSILVDDVLRHELLAYLYDTYAHYYYRRSKTHAGLQYMLKAHEIHTRQSSWAHLAKCRLHMANLLSAQGKHLDAMQSMASILEMIEQNKLEDTSDEHSVGGASAQKICLAAVCYNNLAIEQLHLRAFEAASVSTGNAKRLAKLCLSYSNRWLAQFGATSRCVDLAIATLMEDAHAASNAKFKGA